jgi:hypothetical protein
MQVEENFLHYTISARTGILHVNGHFLANHQVRNADCHSYPNAGLYESPCIFCVNEDILGIEKTRHGYGYQIHIFSFVLGISSVHELFPLSPQKQHVPYQYSAFFSVFQHYSLLKEEQLVVPALDKQIAYSHLLDLRKITYKNLSYDDGKDLLSTFNFPSN